MGRRCRLVGDAVTRRFMLVLHLGKCSIRRFWWCELRPDEHGRQRVMWGQWERNGLSPQAAGRYCCFRSEVGRRRHLEVCVSKLKHVAKERQNDEVAVGGNLLPFSNITLPNPTRACQSTLRVSTGIDHGYKNRKPEQVKMLDKHENHQLPRVNNANAPARQPLHLLMQQCFNSKKRSSRPRHIP